jgi:sugar phosphate isomerase/epimerase
LIQIQHRIPDNIKILVENINYSPVFLKKFWQSGLCEFCLDMGHLMLGSENVSETTRRFMPMIKEIHAHGVRGYDEHLSLTVLPEARVSHWVNLLMAFGFRGVFNIEVFSAEDLRASIRLLRQIIQPCEG